MVFMLLMVFLLIKVMVFTGRVAVAMPWKQAMNARTELTSTQVVDGNP